MKTNTISVNERTNINIFSDNGVWTDRPEVKIYLSVKPDNSRVMLSVCEMILTFKESDILPFDDVMAELFRRDRKVNTVSDVRVGKFGRIVRKIDLTYNSEDDSITFGGLYDGEEIEPVTFPSLEFVSLLYEAREDALR